MTVPPPSATRETLDNILERAQRELTALTNRLTSTIAGVWNGTAAWDDVTDIMATIDQLQADTRTAMFVLGQMSPWVPTAQYNTDRVPDAFNMAIRGIEDFIPNGDPRNIMDGDKFRYPQLERAVDWLREVGLSTSDELAAMTTDQRLRSFADPGINDPATLEIFKSELEQSLEAGESLPEFRKRIKGRVDVARNREEMAYRTNTKRAYVDGLEKTLDAPAVVDRFPYVVFNSTDDNRVRDHHWELDGLVAEKGTKLYALMMDVLREHNCRCNVIPITAARAAKMGINTLNDVSPEFRTAVAI